MRQSHDEQIKRWATFVRNNPDKWKKIHTDFIDAQYEKSKGFYQRLLKEKNGKEKIIRIYKIRNLEGDPSLRESGQDNNTE